MSIFGHGVLAGVDVDRDDETGRIESVSVTVRMEPAGVVSANWLGNETIDEDLVYLLGRPVMLNVRGMPRKDVGYMWTDSDCVESHGAYARELHCDDYGPIAMYTRDTLGMTRGYTTWIKATGYEPNHATAESKILSALGIDPDRVIYQDFYREDGD